MHGLEDEADLTRHALEQVAHFVEGELVVAVQPLLFLLADAAAERLLRVDGAAGEHERQVPEILSHLELVGEAFDALVVETGHGKPEAAEVAPEVVW